MTIDITMPNGVRIRASDKTTEYCIKKAVVGFILDGLLTKPAKKR
jgi:hypothetical protein